MKAKQYSVIELIKVYDKKRQFFEKELSHLLGLDTSVFVDPRQMEVYCEMVAKTKVNLDVTNSTLDILDKC